MLVQGESLESILLLLSLLVKANDSRNQDNAQQEKNYGEWLPASFLEEAAPGGTTPPRSSTSFESSSSIWAAV